MSLLYKPRKETSSRISWQSCSTSRSSCSRRGIIQNFLHRVSCPGPEFHVLFLVCLLYFHFDSPNQWWAAISSPQFGSGRRLCPPVWMSLHMSVTCASLPMPASNLVANKIETHYWFQSCSLPCLQFYNIYVKYRFLIFSHCLLKVYSLKCVTFWDIHFQYFSICKKNFWR